MVQKSKYSQQTLDTLIQELIIVLEKHSASVDLSLIALGHLVSNILQHNFPHSHQREMMSEAFVEALLKSIQRNE